jgi:hypothetical protein
VDPKVRLDTAVKRKIPFPEGPQSLVLTCRRFFRWMKMLTKLTHLCTEFTECGYYVYVDDEDEK